MDNAIPFKSGFHASRAKTGPGSFRNRGRLPFRHQTELFRGLGGVLEEEVAQGGEAHVADGARLAVGLGVEVQGRHGEAALAVQQLLGVIEDLIISSR